MPDEKFAYKAALIGLGSIVAVIAALSVAAWWCGY